LVTQGDFHFYFEVYPYLYPWRSYVDDRSYQSRSYSVAVCLFEPEACKTRSLVSYPTNQPLQQFQVGTARGLPKPQVLGLGGVASFIPFGYFITAASDKIRNPVMDNAQPGSTMNTPPYGSDAMSRRGEGSLTEKD